MTQQETVFIQNLKNTLQVTKLLLADKEVVIYQLTQENARLESILRLPTVAEAVKILQDEVQIEAGKEVAKSKKRGKKETANKKK